MLDVSVTLPAERALGHRLQTTNIETTKIESAEIETAEIETAEIATVMRVVCSTRISPCRRELF